MERKIHYCTGGHDSVNGGKSEYYTLCGRKFDKWDEERLQSGYVGAQNTTCNRCKAKLEYV